MLTSDEDHRGYFGASPGAKRKYSRRHLYADADGAVNSLVRGIQVLGKKSLYINTLTGCKGVSVSLYPVCIPRKSVYFQLVRMIRDTGIQILDIFEYPWLDDRPNNRAWGVGGSYRESPVSPVSPVSEWLKNCYLLTT